MVLRFTKMHGAGNDFVAVDDWRRTVPWRDSSLMASIAARRTGIGCEGILFIQSPDAGSAADFHMRFLNPDGLEAGMCGNGARCAALFAYRHGFAGRRQRIAVGSGEVQAEILRPDFLDGEVRLTTPAPGPIDSCEIQTSQGPLRCYCIDTGVPHAVLFVEEVDRVDVRGLGREIRRHDAFAPAGVNVDFVQSLPEGQLRVRTYERGVEDESGACGTGALASALVAMKELSCNPPMILQVSSGDRLVVGMTDSTSETGAGCPTLTGPAREVFQGFLDLAGFGTHDA